MSRTEVLLCLTAAAGLVAVTVVSQPTEAASPQFVTYQGRLTDSNGKPLEGSVGKLTFRLYSTPAPSPTALLWEEAHETVPVHRGVFTVLLGKVNPLDSGILNGSDRFLEIQVNGDPPLAPLNQLGAVPFAVSAGGSVPVGGIVDWLRPSPTTLVPEGWAVCDGTAINDAFSPLNLKNTPNLVQRFVRCADPAQLSTGYGYDAGNNPTISDQGGAESHQLQHTHHMTHDHGRIQGSTLGANGGGDGAAAAGGYYTHFHNIDLPPMSFTGTTGELSTGGNFDNKPPFVGLIKIMRIK